MKKTALFIFWFFIFALHLVSYSNESSSRELIQQGNHNYLEGRYSTALDFYLKASEKITNGYLYYNIGNCYYRLDKEGEAFAYYRKAQKLIPGFQDLHANIGYLMEEKTDELAGETTFKLLKSVLFFHDSLALPQLLTLVLIFLAFSLIFFTLRVYLHKNRFTWLTFKKASSEFFTPKWNIEVSSDISNTCIKLFKLFLILLYPFYFCHSNFKCIPHWNEFSLSIIFHYRVCF
ncbi:MAG: tetratricopeptide repeat protein [Nitrospinae bacterium]|nr:tetratricopeptide repeat protein [Nitrospinota bacterium]